MGNFFRNLSVIERAIVIIGGALLLLPDSTSNYVGGAVVVAFLLEGKLMSKKIT